MPLLICRRTDRFPSLECSTILSGPLTQTLRLENGDENAEISLLLCGDAEIQRLNKTHRGKDAPTDVLSFAQNDPDVLGDIVISLDTAQRQAETANWPLTSEIVLLAVHGLLHLLGHDDETLAGATEMQRVTRQVLELSQIALPPGGAAHPFFASYE